MIHLFLRFALASLAICSVMAFVTHQLRLRSLARTCERSFSESSGVSLSETCAVFVGICQIITGMWLNARGFIVLLPITFLLQCRQAGAILVTWKEVRSKERLKDSQGSPGEFRLKMSVDNLGSHVCNPQRHAPIRAQGVLVIPP